MMQTGTIESGRSRWQFLFPEGLREERKARLLRHQEDISTQRLERKIGRRIRVLIDDIDEDGAIARSSADAPEIDGTVRIPKPGKLQAGDWADVEVTAAGDYDLTARVSRSR